jgi:hypothetical protein
MTTLNITSEISISFDRENENFKRSYENFKHKWVLGDGSEIDYLKIVLARYMGLMNGKLEKNQLVQYGIEIKGI